MAVRVAEVGGHEGVAVGAREDLGGEGGVVGPIVGGVGGGRGGGEGAVQGSDLGEERLEGGVNSGGWAR